MLGLGAPEVHRHLGKHTLCLAASRGSYASLYKQIDFGNYFFFGLDIWAPDGEGAIACVAISPPLRPSEQTGFGQNSGFVVNWKPDSTRICALALSNVYLLDVSCLLHFTSHAAHSCPAQPKESNILKLRSIGGVYIPGTFSMGSTDEFMFFCQEDGLLLQYSWDMAFVRVVTMPAAFSVVGSWPPQKAVFARAPNALITADESAVKPIWIEWSGDISSALCDDGSLCFLMASTSREFREGHALDNEILCTNRFKLLDRKVDKPKRILHTVFLRNSVSSFDDQALLGDCVRNIHMACLVAVPTRNNLCRIELMVILLRLSNDVGPSGLIGPAVFVSVVSTVYLSIDCCMSGYTHRNWSTLLYPYLSPALCNQAPSSSSDLQLKLSSLHLQSCRTDEVIVTLGGRVFAVKLDVLVSDEKSDAFSLYPIADISFSLDACAVIRSLEDLARPFVWRDCSLLVCYLSSNSELVIVQSDYEQDQGRNLIIQNSVSENPTGKSSKTSKHYHFPLFCVTSPILAQTPTGASLNCLYFSLSCHSLYIPKEVSVGSRSVRAEPEHLYGKRELFANEIIDFKHGFNRIRLPKSLLIDSRHQDFGWVVALEPSRSLIVLFLNTRMSTQLAGSTLWVYHLQTKRWKDLTLQSLCTRFFDGNSIKTSINSKSGEKRKSLIVQSCQLFRGHSCVFTALWDSKLTLEVISLSFEKEVRKGDDISTYAASSFNSYPTVDGHDRPSAKTYRLPTAHSIYVFPPATSALSALSAHPITYMDLSYLDFGASEDHFSHEKLNDKIDRCMCIFGNQYVITSSVVTAQFPKSVSNSLFSGLNHNKGNSSPHRVEYYSISAPLWVIDLTSMSPAHVSLSCPGREEPFPSGTVYVRNPIRRVVGMPTFNSCNSLKAGDAEIFEASIGTFRGIGVAILDAVGQLFRVRIGDTANTFEYIPIKTGREDVLEIPMPIPKSSPAAEEDGWTAKSFVAFRSGVRDIAPMYNSGEADLTLLNRSNIQSIRFSVLLLTKTTVYIQEVCSVAKARGLDGSTRCTYSSFEVELGALFAIWLPLKRNNIVFGEGGRCNDLNTSYGICSATTLVYYSGCVPCRLRPSDALTISIPSAGSSYDCVGDGSSCYGENFSPLEKIILLNPVNKMNGNASYLFYNCNGVNFTSTLFSLKNISLTVPMLIWSLRVPPKDIEHLGLAPPLSVMTEGRRLETPVIYSFGNRLQTLLVASALMKRITLLPRPLYIFVNDLESFLLNLVQDPLFNGLEETVDNHTSRTDVDEIYYNLVSALFVLNRYLVTEVLSRICRKLELSQCLKMFPLPALQALNDCPSVSGLRLSAFDRLLKESEPLLEKADVCMDTRSNSNCNGFLSSESILSLKSPKHIEVSDLSLFLGLPEDVDTLTQDYEIRAHKTFLPNSNYSAVRRELISVNEFFSYCLKTGDLNHAARLLPIVIFRFDESSVPVYDDPLLALYKRSYILALELLGNCWKHQHLDRLVRELISFIDRITSTFSDDTRENALHAVVSDDSCEPSESWSINSFLKSMLYFFEPKLVDRVLLDTHGLSAKTAQNPLREVLMKRLTVNIPSADRRSLNLDIWKYDRSHPFDTVQSAVFPLYQYDDILGSVLVDLMLTLNFISVSFIIDQMLSYSISRKKIEKHVQSVLSDLACRNGPDFKIGTPASMHWLPHNVKIMEHLLSVLNVVEIHQFQTQMGAENYVLDTILSSVSSGGVFAKKIFSSVSPNLLLLLHEVELNEEKNMIYSFDCSPHPDNNVDSSAVESTPIGQSEANLISPVNSVLHNTFCPPRYNELRNRHSRVEKWSPFYFLRVLAIANVLIDGNLDIFHFCALIDPDKKRFNTLQILSGPASEIAIGETILSSCCDELFTYLLMTD